MLSSRTPLLQSGARDSRASSIADTPDQLDLDRPAPGISTPSECDWWKKGFTWPAIGFGLFWATISCGSSFYFGLMTGSTTGDPLAVAVMSTLFLSPLENMVVVSIAVGGAAIPMVTGLIGPLPALRLGQGDTGSLEELDFVHQLFWCFALCCFGPFVSWRWWKGYNRLPFPYGKALGEVIKPDDAPQHDGLVPAATDSVQERKQQLSWNCFMAAVFLSGLWAAIVLFLPFLYNWPLFGCYASEAWLWDIQTSFAFVGMGIIAGPEVALHMVLGALYGWVLLAFIARRARWVTRDPADWTHGVQGWIIWPALAILLAESSIEGIWVVYEMKRSFMRQCAGRQAVSDSVSLSPGQSTAAEDPHAQDPHHHGSGRRTEVQEEVESMSRPGNSIIGLFVATTFCVLGVNLSIGFSMPFSAILLAVGIAVVLVFPGLQVAGITGTEPASALAKLAQLVFAIIPFSTSDLAFRNNLLAGAIAESAPAQAADLMNLIKAGQGLRIPPTPLITGQLIGSVWGAFVASSLRSLSANPAFPKPKAHMWAATSKFFLGHRLPPGSLFFMLGTGSGFLLLTTLRILPTVPWAWLATVCPRLVAWSLTYGSWIPSGASVAIGMYNVPGITLPWAFGGVVRFLAMHYNRDEDGRETERGKRMIYMVASGLIFGEGVVSFVSMAKEVGKDALSKYTGRH